MCIYIFLQIVDPVIICSIVKTYLQITFFYPPRHYIYISTVVKTKPKQNPNKTTSVRSTYFVGPSTEQLEGGLKRQQPHPTWGLPIFLLLSRDGFPAPLEKGRSR